MKFTFREKLGCPSDPYLVRWVLDFGYFSIRLHNWRKSDDMRAKHDHPWWFLSLVLSGLFVDRGDKDVVRKPGSISFFPSSHQHSLGVLKPGYTPLICGPENRKWGFYINGKFIKRNRYFYDYKHH